MRLFITLLFRKFINLTDRIEAVIDYRIAVFMRNIGRKMTLNKELVVSTKHGFRMRVSPYDYSSYDIYFFGDYDPDTTTLFTTLIRPGQQVWDLGTDRGWFTLLAGKLVGPSGHVFSFEAFPPNYKKLKKNVLLNKMAWVTTINAAVSDKVGEAWFSPPSDEATSYIKFLGTSSGVGHMTDERHPDSIRVKTITINQYAKLKGIKSLDLMKIDIEGAEYKALIGGKRTILKYKPIIIIEYNRGTANRLETTIEKLDALLDKYGYDRYIYKNGYLPVTYGKDKKIDYPSDVYNVCCLPK